MSTRPGQSETIVILDFGSQYAQLIARRVRENGVYSVLARPDVTVQELRGLNPKGLIFTGGPASVYEKGAPRCRPEVLDIGRAGPGHLLRHAARLPDARGRRARRRPAASTAGRRCKVLRDDPLLERRAARDHRVDEPRRPGPHAERRLRAAGGHAHLPRRGRPAQEHARSTACSSTPRSPTRRTARRSSSTSCTTSAAARACGRWARSSTRWSETVASDRGQRRAGDLRPVGRGGFIGGRGPAAPGDRRAPGVHLRGQRPAAGERGGAGPQHLRGALHAST